MWDNKYQRYFKGHVQEVTTLAMNPKNDMLLSGARVSLKPVAQLCSLAASLVLQGSRQCSCLLPSSAAGCFSAALPSGANSALCGDLSLATPSPAQPPVEPASARLSNDGKCCLQDNQVRLWDLRTPACQGILNTPGPACASFDQQVRSPLGLCLFGTAWKRQEASRRAGLMALRCCWQLLPPR